MKPEPEASQRSRNVRPCRTVRQTSGMRAGEQQQPRFGAYAYRLDQD